MRKYADHQIQPGVSQKPIEPPKPDPAAETLVQNGLVPNAFILDQNKALTVPRDMELSHPWNLPSRLFMFPIEVTDQAKDGSRRGSPGRSLIFSSIPPSKAR